MALEGIGADKVVPIETLRAGKRERARIESGRPPAKTDADSGVHVPSEAIPPAPVELSPEAEAALERERQLREVRADIESLPDVRTEKVIEARIKISKGFYERPDVQAEIARRFLSEPAVPPKPTILDPPVERA